LVKDKYELEIISKACSITDKAFNRIIKYSPREIREFNELSMANRLEGICIKNGGSGRSFDYVIASGPGSSMPHYISSHKDIKENILLMDFGTLHKHYCSDITRTIFTRKEGLDKKIKDIYKIVLEAQQKALEACREGIRCDQLDSIARKYIEEAGYGDQFGHGLGHGVGLEVHEGPYVTRKNKTVLKENMVITVEPGIYIPGLGGVRIEDMVVVKKNGCRNLYSSKKDFTFLS
jgi:Xaa-Pro aminopeptidase